jgi:hypothetical protein
LARCERLDPVQERLISREQEQQGDDMQAPALRRVAQVVSLLSLLSMSLLCDAVTQDAGAAQLTLLLDSPSGKVLIIAGVLVIASLSIWLSAVILGLEGGFWLSGVAALVAVTLGAIAHAILPSDTSVLSLFTVGVFTGAAGVKLCFDASFVKALVCSVLSSVMATFLSLVVLIILGIQFMSH